MVLQQCPLMVLHFSKHAKTVRYGPPYRRANGVCRVCRSTHLCYFLGQEDEETLTCFTQFVLAHYRVRDKYHENLLYISILLIITYLLTYSKVQSPS